MVEIIKDFGTVPLRPKTPEEIAVKPTDEECAEISKEFHRIVFNQQRERARRLHSSGKSRTDFATD